jgi:carboxypeptidase PM20D1
MQGSSQGCHAEVHRVAGAGIEPAIRSYPAAVWTYGRETFVIRVLLFVLIALAGIIGVRTWMYKPAPLAEATAQSPAAAPVTIDDGELVAHLGEAIRFPTISNAAGPASMDVAAFEGFLGWVEQTYPLVMTELRARRVGGYSLLLTWQGSDASKGPVLLAGHYDVVPVVPGTEDEWTHPPFAGWVADGYVWGRGALDNKNAVVALLEAVNHMIAHGEHPTRTVYLSFGHDEEIGGEQGAAAVVEALRAEGVKLAWSLDEGSFVIENMFPGLATPLALVNTAEKGFVDVQLVAHGQGGHSSMPPARTAVGELAAALVELQDRPLRGGLEGLAESSFDAIGPHLPLMQRAAFANRWLFGPLLERELGKTPAINAMLRTTTAPTMLAGSPKSNVLPIEATATVNFRIHPRDSVAGVVEHVRGAIGNDTIDVQAVDGNEPSAVSDFRSEGFELIRDAVVSEFGPLVVAPGLMVAASDTRHYGQIAENAFRFNPMIVTQDEVAGFHGTNERISTAGFAKGVRTYVRLLRSL